MDKVVPSKEMWSESMDKWDEVLRKAKDGLVNFRGEICEPCGFCEAAEDEDEPNCCLCVLYPVYCGNGVASAVLWQIPHVGIEKKLGLIRQIRDEIYRLGVEWGYAREEVKVNG